MKEGRESCLEHTLRIHYSDANVNLTYTHNVNLKCKQEVLERHAAQLVLAETKQSLSLLTAHRFI